MRLLLTRSLNTSGSRLVIVSWGSSAWLWSLWWSSTSSNWICVVCWVGVVVVVVRLLIVRIGIVGINVIWVIWIVRDHWFNNWVGSGTTATNTYDDDDEDADDKEHGSDYVDTVLE